MAPTPDAFARHVLTRRLAVKPKESVLIETYPSSLRWATAFVRQARRLDARPTLLYEDERSYWDAIGSGHVDALGQPGSAEWAALEAADVYVYFWGPENLARRQRLPDGVDERATAYNREWYDRARKAGVRGARMEIAKATPENARFYGLPVRRWRSALLEATMRDPRTYQGAIRKLSGALSKGKEVRLTAAGGTDVHLALDHGPVRTFDGRRERPSPKRWRFASMATIPSAAVGCRLRTTVAEGTVVANRPSYLGTGVARGGVARFSDGRMTRLSFREGGPPVLRAYRKASKGRDRAGILEIGLEPTLQGIPDLEDCEAGAVTIGIGTNTGWGGTNGTNFMTWLVVAGGQLSIDGRPVLRAGRIL